MKIMRIRFFAPAGQRPSDPLPTHLKLVTFPTTRLGIGNVGGDGVSAASPLRFVYATIVLLNTNTMIFALGGDSRASCRLDDVFGRPSTFACAYGHARASSVRFKRCSR